MQAKPVQAKPVRQSAVCRNRKMTMDEPFSTRRTSVMQTFRAHPWVPTWLVGAGTISFQSRLILAFCAVLVVGIAGLVANVISIHQIRTQVEESHTAHHELADYLHLANDTHQVLKQMTATVLSDGPDMVPIGTMLQRAMRSELASIRAQIRWGNMGEAAAARLDRLEMRLKEIDAGYNEVVSLYDTGNEEEALSVLGTLVRDTDYQEIFNILSGFIEIKHSQVHDLDDDGRRLINLAETVVYLQVLFTVPFMIFVGVYLVHQLRGPLRRLTEGTDAIAGGDLVHRIPPLRSTEFEHLGQSFNRMAVQLDGQRSALHQLNQGLEDRIAARTADLQVANERMARTDKARRRLFADISHELRTPLTIMRGEAEVSLRGDDKAAGDYQESLRRIVMKCGHMGRLVDDLLFIARADAGETRFETRPVPVVPLLLETVRDFRPSADQKDLTLELDPALSGGSAAPRDPVLADPGRLRQVFSILIDNAVRYCAAGERIDIAAHRRDASMVVMVSDTGQGVPEQDLPHVFERFYRGANSSKVKGGTGLGLPVAKAIVDALGGTITLENRPERGVTVTLMLPLVPDDDGPEPGAPKGEV